MTVYNLFCFLLLLFCDPAAAKKYHITPTEYGPCPIHGQPCLTLSEFAANSSIHSDPSPTLILLSGNHKLHISISISNADHFVMQPENIAATIICEDRSRLTFNSVEHIHIKKIRFIGCGGNTFQSVGELLLEHSRFQGQDVSSTALELTGTAAQIINNTFVCNKMGTVKGLIKIRHVIRMNATIGGAIIASYSNVSINQSQFENNSAEIGGAIFAQNRSRIILLNTHFVGGNCTARNASVGGVLYLEDSIMTISNSQVDGSAAAHGGAVFAVQSIVEILNTFLVNSNAAELGGALFFYNSSAVIKGSHFKNNTASIYGGAVLAEDSSLNVDESNFSSNTVRVCGGAIRVERSNVMINVSQFYNNLAMYGGGGLHSRNSTVKINGSMFCSNIATGGGAAVFVGNNVLINESWFDGNTAVLSGGDYREDLINRFGTKYFSFTENTGGAVFLAGSNVRINGPQAKVDNSPFNGGTRFTDNIAAKGAALYISDCRVNIYGLFIVNGSTANENAAVFFRSSRGELMGTTIISNNTGSLMVYDSHITLLGNTTFVNCSPSLNTSAVVKEGGALTLYESVLVFNGTCVMKQNHAENGGAIHVSVTKLYVNGELRIANNTATSYGGGIYLYHSELNCRWKGNLQIVGNNATEKGGGIHAVSSLIKATCTETGMYCYDHLSKLQLHILSTGCGTNLEFIENKSERGGGISLEASVKLYVFKYVEVHHESSNVICNISRITDVLANTSAFIHFISNKADYGAAVYVDDDTYSATCAVNQRDECFFQTLRLALSDLFTNSEHYFRFVQNDAEISGSILYGGLLDRCTLSPFTEQYDAIGNHYNGITYFQEVSANINMEEISSGPLRVCFCTNNHPNCSYQQSSPIEVMKGQAFHVQLVSVNQIGDPVHATIRSHLNSSQSDLVEGQMTQTTRNCKSVLFRIISPHKLETLIVYASNGPCKDAALSTKKIHIHFLPCTCPIGFQPSEINERSCECRCHDDISSYVKCNVTTQSFKRHSSIWIAYVTFKSGNDTKSGFLIYLHCPFDYCNKIASVNLNQPNGTDAQCVFNRTGLLCGSCQPGLSLSLGSSRCLSCDNNWPAIFTLTTFAAILAGIVLVIALFALNVTVAEGTFNALIFFANVVYTHKSILLQASGLKYFALIISWLNLELGIDTCYFPGMDAYFKTWLQLMFPLYIILLAILIIIVSKCSSKFSRFIGEKKPVETLATLILLSYTKLLEAIIGALSFGILKYPDGTITFIWLPDATVKYLTGKHIALFIVAVIILLVGILFTILVFSWQWLSKWMQNPRLLYSVRAYHEPYTPKHRYWPGLLLLIRAILYLVATLNVSGNPQVEFVSIVTTVGFITVIRVLLPGRLYKDWILDVLETVVCVHILSFVMFSWYTFDAEHGQEIVANMSIGLTYILLLIVIFYHLCRTWIFSKPNNMIYLLRRKCCHQSNNLTDRNDPIITLSESHQNLCNPPKPTSSTVAMSNCLMYK